LMKWPPPVEQLSAEDRGLLLGYLQAKEETTRSGSLRRYKETAGGFSCPENAATAARMTVGHLVAELACLSGDGTALVADVLMSWHWHLANTGQPDTVEDWRKLWRGE